MLLVSSDEDDAEMQATRVFPCTLGSKGVIHGTKLRCEDFLQKYEFQLVVRHAEDAELGEAGYVIGGDAVAAEAEAEAEAAPSSTDMAATAEGAMVSESSTSADPVLLADGDDADVGMCAVEGMNPARAKRQRPDDDDADNDDENGALTDAAAIVVEEEDDLTPMETGADRDETRGPPRKRIAR